MPGKVSDKSGLMSKKSKADEETKKQVTKVSYPVVTGPSRLSDEVLNICSIETVERLCASGKQAAPTDEQRFKQKQMEELAKRGLVKQGSSEDSEARNRLIGLI